MAKEWTDEEVAAEISKAVQIVREDRIDTLIRNRLSAPSGQKDDGKNDPPSSGGNDDNSSGKKKGSLWWGSTE